MQRKHKVYCILTLILFLILLPLWLGRVSLAVRYHLWLMASAWKTIGDVGPADSTQSTYIEWYETHRDALVDYGYFERREFVLSKISVPSLESKRLWQELESTFADHPHVTMQGYEPETPDTITVWDRPDRIKEWASIIQAHEMLPNPHSTRAMMPPGEDYTGFAGTWVAEDGDVVYEILNDENGGLRIESWSSATWQTTIKNLRAENGGLLFDQYFRTPPSEKLKTIISASGEHPFSGVRCVTELRLSENNKDVLQQNMSTINLTEPITGTLRRLK